MESTTPGWAKTLYFYARDNTSGVFYVFRIAFEVLLGILEFFRNAGLMVNLALLLVAVALNYGLTRMVLNYQRRQ